MANTRPGIESITDIRKMFDTYVSYCNAFKDDVKEAFDLLEEYESLKEKGKRIPASLKKDLLDKFDDFITTIRLFYEQDLDFVEKAYMFVDDETEESKFNGVWRENRNNSLRRR